MSFGVRLGAPRTALAALALVLMASAGFLVSPAAVKSETTTVKSEYKGPLVVSDPERHNPRVRFPVVTTTNPKRRPRTVTVVNWFSFGPIPLTCADGGRIWIGAKHSEDTRVRSRRFVISDTDQDQGMTIEVSGQLPREGPATGTARFYWNQSGVSSPAMPCDSGVMSWSAEKIG